MTDIRTGQYILTVSNYLSYPVCNTSSCLSIILSIKPKWEQFDIFFTMYKNEIDYRLSNEVYGDISRR